VDEQAFHKSALLTVAEMYRADAAAEAAGVSSDRLMEAAGAGVADAVRDLGGPRRVTVLCGSGNNGGDGFVAARLLKNDGWPVRLALLGDRETLKGDARTNAERWEGPVEPLDVSVLDDAEIVVDALFGAGLTRPLDGVARAVIEAIAPRPCVAVDVPSGVHGDTGAVLGAAPDATTTVTFFRRKPGHLLLPGRVHCGAVRLVDIGIPERVLSEIAPRQAGNASGLWLGAYPPPRPDQHKYDRGHLVVSGGPQLTGAARLAARAALRVGAGMVSVAVPADNAVVYKVALVSVIVRAMRDTAAYAELIDDPRVTACLVGPGNGLGGATREQALAALRAGKRTVLDADALTVFADAPELLMDSIDAPCILTPHLGEFRRLFEDTGDKLADARAAAAKSGAVMLLKGADTVIAALDGRAVINENASADLASAGTGDVLAGFVAGLLAQGLDAFDAACAGTWLHGAVGATVGPGLIAEDLPDALPAVLQALRSEQN
jgi:NAD(P)H-hydrate epimerase